MTHDYIVKSLAFDGEIRAYALTTESVQEAQTRHYTWPAMGRTMTTLLMGSMLKGEQN